MAQPTKNPNSSSPPTADMASFGKIAIRMGFISQNQLDEAIKAQSAAAKAGLRKRLGEILIQKGYLTQDQFQQVLKGQTVNRKRIGQYELISKLGEGGMGSVFKARQVYMDRVIALKILSPKMAKNKDFLRRFVREARAVAKLNHPHIVAGIDVGSADGYCYFAMEYVEGETLGEYMHHKGGKLSEKVTLNFIHQTAMALQHAHENHLLHRDVKPDNILLDKEHKVAKLADLGLVRSAESKEDDAALTQAGQAVGTPFYISPEQARGVSDLTAATDVYSLGASLYHLLTGEVPYDGQTAAVIMTRHLTDPVPSPKKINAKLSVGADKLVMRAMQKDPTARFTSMLDFADAIEAVQRDGDYDDEHLSNLASVAGDTPVARKPKERPATPASSRQVGRAEEGNNEVDEDEDDSDDRPQEQTRHASTGPHSATRVRRRRQGNDYASLLIAVLIIVASLAVLYYWNPFKQDPVKRAVVTTTNKTTGTGTATQTPAVPTAPVGQPAALHPDPGGGKSFIADFKHPSQNFDVEPVANIGPLPEVVPEREALRLAPVRDGDFALNARLVLPSDLVVSPNATCTFLVFLLSDGASDLSPDIEVRWDNKQDTFPKRAESRWKLNDPKFKTAWTEVKVQLKSAPIVLPSNQSETGPQFISIWAGKAGQKLTAFIAKLEIHDNPADKTPPPVPPAPRNAPKDAPKQPDTPQPEAPVAPPKANGKKKPDEKKTEADAIKDAL